MKVEKELFKFFGFSFYKFLNIIYYNVLRCLISFKIFVFVNYNKFIEFFNFKLIILS